MIDFRFCNNLDYMATVGDQAFDLAIVDPPYGINAPNMSTGQNLSRNDGWKRGESTAVKAKGRLNRGSGKLKDRILNKSDIEWDNSPPPPEYFNELFRVSKNQIIWGGNYFYLPPTRCILCWDKRQPWENFSQWEMAWTSFDSPAAHFSFSNTGGANGKKKIHPTEKPVELYEWILRRYAKPGFKILDTHGGSGNIAIACYNAGFDLVLCENKKVYFDDSLAAYNSHVAKYSPATDIKANLEGQIKLF